MKRRLVLLAIPLVVLLLLVLMYNTLVQGRNHCDEAWRTSIRKLKRRYDLIPNLVKTVQGYASTSGRCFDSVSQARASAYGQ